jgi:signal transduction histidine kinase
VGRGTLLAALAAGALVTTAAATRSLDRFELPVRDLVLRAMARESSQHVMVVAVDERSLAREGAWPWDREKIAGLVDRIAATPGVDVIALDILLSEERPGDGDLAVALARKPAILAATLGDDGWILPPARLRSVTETGHAMLDLDHDGVLRRLMSTKQNGELALPALAIAATGAAVPVGRMIVPRFATRPDSIPTVSATDILHGDPLPLADRRIVFIGVAARGMGDHAVIPGERGTVPGVVVHALVAEDLVEGRLMQRAWPLVNGALAAIAVLLAGWRRYVALIVPAVALAALIAGVETALVTLALTVVIATAVRETLVAVRTQRERTRETEARHVLVHELRTPATSLRGLTQLLEGFDLDAAERKRVTQLIGRETGRLQSMIDRLLEIDRLSMRDFDRESVPLRLDEIAAERVALLRDPRVHSIDNTAVRVRGDGVLLGRVVDNLLSNALKYSTGPVYLRVRDDGTLEVEDEGPGIPPAERTRVLERFTRGSTSKGTDGLGLGLALVADIVAWHRGRLVIDEGAAGGALIRISLPPIGAAREVA